jgi:CheY-like chemotaxis protein
MLVLYVEDDLEDLENFRDILQLVNPEIKCIHAKNGRAGLDLLDDLLVAPDYIFLDINMPVMDGQEMFLLLQRDKRHRAIPVVIYTTSNRKEDKDKFLRLGVQHYVIKPNSFKEAVDGLAKVLRKL